MRIVLNTHLTVKKFFVRYGVASAFLFLAFVGGYSIERSSHREDIKLRAAQVAACERGNDARSENNKRIAAHVADRDTLSEFLRTAADARVDIGTPRDLQAAESYRKLANSLEKTVTFDKLTLVDCQKIIPQP